MKDSFGNESRYAALEFRRPERGPVWPGIFDEFDLSGANGWQSNGGDYRGHPARALPYSLEIPLTGLQGEIKRLEVFGVFALYAESDHEAAGTFGATIQVLGEREIVFRQDLVNGRHYDDATDLKSVSRQNGDGTSLESVGTVELEGKTVRVDRLSIDLPDLSEVRSLIFKDLGSSASFLIFDIFVEAEEVRACPFHSRSGQIPLREVASIVRVGDRRRFAKALDQLLDGIQAATDLDEGRGQALTFLAVVTAGMLESGGSRSMHRIQLEAARSFEQLQDLEDIAHEARALCEKIAEPLFAAQDASPSAHLVDKALAIVERNYAKNLTDAIVASQLGLSTSHFRFLFKQATGNPFHKYLVAVRLEKARQLLLENEMPVSQVASAVGFTGLSHFSRAFTQRFSASPTSIRRVAG